MFTSDTLEYDDNLVSLYPVVTVNIPTPHLHSEIKRPTGFLISAVSKRVDVLHFSVVENQLHVICRDHEAKKAVQWTLDRRITTLTMSPKVKVRFKLLHTTLLHISQLRRILANFGRVLFLSMLSRRESAEAGYGDSAFVVMLVDRDSALPAEIQS